MVYYSQRRIQRRSSTTPLKCDRLCFKHILYQNGRNPDIGLLWTSGFAVVMFAHAHIIPPPPPNEYPRSASASKGITLYYAKNKWRDSSRCGEHLGTWLYILSYLEWRFFKLFRAVVISPTRLFLPKIILYSFGIVIVICLFIVL